MNKKEIIKTIIYILVIVLGVGFIALMVYTGNAQKIFPGPSVPVSPIVRDIVAGGV